MIEVSFLAAELAFAVIWLLVRIAVWIRQRKIVWKREATLLLMYVNLAVIIRFVFFPRELVNGSVQPLYIYTDMKEAPALQVNLIPFVRLFDFAYIRDFIWNVTGNVAMFIPSGIVLPIVYKGLDKWHLVMLAGVSISLIIEILQLPMMSRASDIDDLILNSFGVLIGYGIYVTMRYIHGRVK